MPCSNIIAVLNISEIASDLQIFTDILILMEGSQTCTLLLYVNDYKIRVKRIHAVISSCWTDILAFFLGESRNFYFARHTQILQLHPIFPKLLRIYRFLLISTSAVHVHVICKCLLNSSQANSCSHFKQLDSYIGIFLGESRNFQFAFHAQILQPTSKFPKLHRIYRFLLISPF